MGFIKFVFVLVILIPIAIVMMYLINKLLHEFNGFVKMEKESKEVYVNTAKSAGTKTYERYTYNDSYAAYKRKKLQYMSTNSDLKKEDNIISNNRSNGSKSMSALDKHKRRKERKKKKR